MVTESGSLTPLNLLLILVQYIVDSLLVRNYACYALYLCAVYIQDSRVHSFHYFC